MHDPCIQICSFPSYAARQWMEKRWWIPRRLARFSLFTLWHHDPNIKGDDDSCGWFKRARHGDEQVLERIEKYLEEDWDRVFKSESGKVYHCGYFYPEDSGAGMPNMGVTAIVLNLFFIAVIQVFKCDGRTSWKKARRFMQANLFDIMIFAENPTDSLRDLITRKWGTETKREDRIHEAASIIYGWILRRTRPWYRHPRWHVHHWHFQIHPWQSFRRAFIERCAKCGKGFRWGEVGIGDWHGKRLWHERCEDSAKPSTHS